MRPLSPAEPFRRYSTWLRERYGGKTYRVSVDAGFSCPGREMGLPCAYCDAAGSRAPYLGDEHSIREQIERGVSFLTRRYAPDHLLLYFQAFSNTYAPVARLREIYDYALDQASFAAMIVGTRPDCIDEERAALLAEYRDRGLDVWVELGLQSVNNATLELIRRGHTVEEFDAATQLLAGQGINVAAHVILGLPGEDADDAIAVAKHLSSLPVSGVKFHNLVVVEGTRLYRQYRKGELEPPGPARYEELLLAALEHLREDIVVMRLTCDPPRGRAHAPERLPDKAALFDGITVRFQERGTRQGIYWSDNADQG